MTVNKQRTINLARELVEIAHPIIEGPNEFKSLNEYSRIVEGVLRKDFFILRTILKLSESEDGIVIAGSLLDLQRTMLEDLLSIEWIKLVGQEKYSKRFWFQQVQELEDEIELIKSAGKEVPPKTIRILIKLKPQAISILGVDKKNKLNNWRVDSGGNRVSIGNMVSCLIKNKKIKNKAEVDILLWAIKAGHEQNHPTPNGIIHFVEPKELESWSDTAVNHTLISGISYITRLSIELLNLTTNNEPLKLKINEIRETIFSKEFYEN